jgi:hypothetical protein
MGLLVRARVVFRTQHATRMHHIVLSFEASLAPPHFSTSSHKRHDFGGGGRCWLQKVSYDFLYSNFSEIFLTIRRIQQDAVITRKHLYANYPYFYQILMK